MNKAKIVVIYKNSLIREYEYSSYDKQELQADLDELKKHIAETYMNGLKSYIHIPSSSNGDVLINLSETVTIEIQFV